MMGAGSSMASLGTSASFLPPLTLADERLNNRGKTVGGVESRAGCAELPQNLQAGCYWRWNWAKGDLNGWDIDYKQIACPTTLENISGCSV